jgi:polyisoprenoid-binding protein YceI
MRRVMVLVLLGSICTLAPAESATAASGCSTGISVAATLSKNPVHVGERVRVTSFVSTLPAEGSVPASCALSNVHSNAIFTGGVNVTLTVNGNVKAGGHTKTFGKTVKIQSAWVSDGEVSVTIDTTALCNGQTVSGSASYSSAVT